MTVDSLTPKTRCVLNLPEPHRPVNRGRGWTSGLRTRYRGVYLRHARDHLAGGVRPGRTAPPTPELRGRFRWAFRAIAASFLDGDGLRRVEAEFWGGRPSEGEGLRHSPVSVRLRRGMGEGDVEGVAWSAWAAAGTGIRVSAIGRSASGVCDGARDRSSDRAASKAKRFLIVMRSVDRVHSGGVGR